MDFLREKWTYFFSSLDWNNDGLITQNDVQETVRDFPLAKGLDLQEEKIADHILEHWWNTYILRDQDEITKIDFVNNFEHDYLKHKKLFVKTMRAMMDEMMGVVNVKHTNRMTVEDYVIVFKVRGHNNDQVIRKSFELYEPENGIISIEEYTELWMLFLTNDDSTMPDVVYNAYKFVENA